MKLAGDKWSASRGLPLVAALGKGTYLISASAYDEAGNRSTQATVDAFPTLSFDGKGSVELLQLKGLPPGNSPHTVEGWVNATRLPADRAWLLILGSETEGNYHWWMDGAGTLFLGCWGGNGQVTPRLSINEWTHIATTFDGTTLKAYVNGAPVGSIAAVFDLQGLMLNLSKPAEKFPWERFNGSLSELRIWNYARSPEEIQDGMSRRLSGKEDGLVLLWHLDEGAGTIAKDASPNGNTGRFSGAPRWTPLSSVVVSVGGRP